MSRPRVTASVPPALFDAIRRAAIIEDRSVSDLVEDAIARYFDGAHRDAEHHAILAKLQRLTQRLASLEQGVETHFELTCHATKFVMSVTPDISQKDSLALNSRGSERFRNTIAAIIARLGSGRSVWRESFAASEQMRTPTADDRDARANGSEAPPAEAHGSTHGAGSQSAE